MCAILVGCTDESPPITVAQLQSEQDADQESWNVQLSIAKEGQTKILLTAGHMLKYDRPDSTFMLLESLDTDSVRVRVDIFNVEGDSSAVVFADRIYYYELEDKFVGKGNVHVSSKENRTIESEHLEWTESDRKLRTPGLATYRSGDFTLTGYSLVANEDLTEATIARPVGTKGGDSE